MKTHLLAVVGIVVAGLLVDAAAQSAKVDRAALNKAFKEGVAAYKQNNLDLAEKRFLFIQRHVRGEPRSGRYLNEIQIKRRARNAVPPMSKRLETVIVPKVEFEEATLEEALDFVRIRTKEITKGRIAPNFVVRAGTSGIDKKPITLNLSNIPMSAVLKYIGDITNTKFSYEKHSIVALPLLSPATSATGSKTPSPGDAAPRKFKDPFD